MASETHRSFLVQRKVLDVVWVIASGSVAIFTLHTLVGRATMRPRIVVMTLEARGRALILNGKVLPLLDVAEAMVVVGKTVAVHAKVIRHQQQPGEKNESYYPYCNP
jgi:hypothetical protein